MLRVGAGETRSTRARSALPLIGWSLAFFVLVIFSRNLAVKQPGEVPAALISPSAGLGLVWFASARSRRELIVDSVAVILVAGLGLWFAAAVGWTGSVPWAQYWALLILPAQYLAPVLLFRRWVPQLWGAGGRRSMRTLPEFGLVLLAMTVSVLAYSLVRTVFAELFIPAESVSLALGRGARALSAMATLGTFGLLLGGWLTEAKDTARSRIPTPSAVDLGTLLGGAVAAVVVLEFDFFLETQAPSTFLLMLVIAWIAIRFTPVLTSGFCLLTGGVVIGLTIANKGTLASVEDPVLRAGLAQLLVVVLMVLGMIISLSRSQVLDSLATLARSEAANARRAAELDLVMANLVDGVAIIEQGGKIMHANTALRTAFGTQEDTAVDEVRPDSEIPDEERLIRGSDGALLRDDISPLTRALAGEDVPAEEWRAPSTAGPIHWVTISGVPLPPEEDGPPRAMLVLRDITSEKAHQDALETRAAELNMVIDNLNDGLAIVEADGTYSQANDALRTIFWGRPDAIDQAGDIEGPSAYHLFHPDGRPLDEDDYPFKRALRGIDVRDEEQHLRRPGAPTQILSVSSYPLPDEAGRKRRAVVVVRDVTLERSYQDGLASFAGTVAHDLNNPLSVIDGWAEAIQEDLSETDDEMARSAVPMVQHIRAGVEQMRGFISDLLAHAVARDQTLRCEWVSLRNMVKHIASQRDRPELRNGGIEVGELPDVWADKLLVRQVVDNLIGNATKYVAPGVTPEIRVSATTTQDGWVEVTVNDNGIGIDPAQQERVFDSFHRASADGYAGTGLGLAICKRIVERHGGTIRVEAIATGGSSFVFALPASAEVFAAATA
jgi:PAS domain S-box-containing protein